MVDLHTHSTASDGSFTPQELMAEAKKSGLSAVALTDHDILAGLFEAEAEAKRLNLIFVRGVEISIDWHPGEFHLLGLGLHKDSSVLDKLLKNLQKERKNRNMRIIEKMRQTGFDISYEKLTAFINAKIGGRRTENGNSVPDSAGNGSASPQAAVRGGIGRPHFASYMAQHGMVKSNQEAFDKYFAKGRPFFEEKTNAGFEEAAAAIKSAGGVPVMAHPMSLYLSWAKLPDAVKRFKALGLEGLEAWNSSTRYNDCRRLEGLAAELGLIVTAGSDFHGSMRKDRKLGLTSGGIKIEDKFYNNLRSLCPHLPPIAEK